MTAVEFLDKLEQQGLLDARLVSTLRQQVAEARKGVSAQKIAKLLIDKGHLTAFQAKKLMDNGARPQPAATRGGKPARPAAADDGLDLLDDDDDDLGLDLVADESPLDDNGNGNDLDLVVEEDPVAQVITPPPPPAKSKANNAPSASPKKEPRVKSAPNVKPPGRGDDSSGLTPIDSSVLNSTDGLTPLGAGSLSSILSETTSGLEPIDPFATQLTAPDPLQGAPNEAVKKKASSGKLPKVKGESQWDTPLMLLGGGAVIGLAIFIFAVIRFLVATDATKAYEAASNSYKGESYPQAVAEFEAFLNEFPSDPNAAAAWVFIRTGKLRQAVQGKSPDRALQTAKEVLAEFDQGIASTSPKVKGIPEAFNDHARPELASMLPGIAGDFATRAKSAKATADAEKNVALAEEAMKLVNNATYIPTPSRETIEARLATIQEDIAIAHRNIKRDTTLAKALTDIRAAIAKNDTPAAFTLRKALIKEFPDLEIHPEVIEAVRASTEKERELVKLVEEARQAITTDDAAAAGVQVVPAAVEGDPAPGVTGSVLTVLARGAVYGLDASSGKVLWRRAVGLESKVHPVRVSREPAADAILIDSQKHEVVRVSGQTGALQWRLPIDANASTPVLVGERLFVATESGTLFEINAATGASGRHVKFPQPLRAPPAVDEARGLVFQTGEHSNLYVLSSETLDCKAVYYLNHRAGSVTLAPVLSRGQVFIAENAGTDYCLIHTLPAIDDLEKLKPAQEAFRLRGNVLAAPYVYERRVVIVTDLGGVYLYEIDVANKKQPVSKIAELRPALREAAIGYSIADAGFMWVADARLVRYEVQAARGEFARQAIRDDGGLYVAPLQMIGSVLFHARRQANSEGIVVTAADSVSLRPYWTSNLAAPVVGLISQPNAPHVAAVTSQGAVYQLQSQGLQSGIQGQFQQPAALAAEMSYEAPFPLPDGRFVFPGVAPKNRILLFDPQASAAPKSVELKLPYGSATAAPVAYQGGLLVPSSAGLVYLADPETGESMALPLRPPMAPGAEVEWQAPAVAADGKEFAIANRDSIYRAVLRQQPKPHLAVLSSRTLEGAVAAPLASTGGAMVYAVERTAAGDSLLAFELPALTLRRFPLSGRLAWGPQRVGDAVLLATYDSLVKLNGGAEPQWTRPLPYGPPIGAPGEAGGNYWFASAGGTVWGVSAETGAESRKSVFADSLAAGPAIVGSSLLVGASDGVLHVVSLSP